MAYTLSPKASDFRGYPFESYTYTRSDAFRKNNCGSGQVGELVDFSKEYISYISLEDAEEKSLADNTFNTQGQAYANTQGTCTATCQPLTRNNPQNPNAVAGIIDNSDPSSLTGVQIYGGYGVNFQTDAPTGRIYKVNFSNIVNSVNNGVVSTPVNRWYFHSAIIPKMSQPLVREDRVYIFPQRSGDTATISYLNFNNPDRCQTSTTAFTGRSWNYGIFQALQIYNGPGYAGNGIVYLTLNSGRFGSAGAYWQSDNPDIPEVYLGGLYIPDKYRIHTLITPQICCSSNGTIYIGYVCKREPGGWFGTGDYGYRSIIHKVNHNSSGVPVGIDSNPVFNKFDINNYLQDIACIDTALAIFHGRPNSSKNRVDFIGPIDPLFKGNIINGLGGWLNVLSAVGSKNRLIITGEMGAINGYQQYLCWTDTRLLSGWSWKES